MKRLIAKDLSQTIAAAKINLKSKQGTNEKSEKIALINVFSLELGSVSALRDELQSFV